MKLLNLTPHPVNIYRRDGDGILAIIHPESVPLRLGEVDSSVVQFAVGPKWSVAGSERTETVNFDENGNYPLAVPVVVRDYQASTLPAPAENTAYIVSLPALMGLRAAGVDRADLVAPDTGPGPWGAVRDERGNVAGCYRLVAVGPVPTPDWGGPWSIEEWNTANPPTIPSRKAADGHL